MIYQYGLEPVLIQRIFIGFEAIHTKLTKYICSVKKVLVKVKKKRILRADNFFLGMSLGKVEDLFT